MLQHFKGSPLWVIALFISFAEVTSGYVSVNLYGGQQVAMVAFIIAYPSIVTLLFFILLWQKPENFYAPSEYGTIAPKDFVDALRGLPSDAKSAVTYLETNPTNEDAIFALIDKLLPEPEKQHLILINDSGKLDISKLDERGYAHRYEIASARTVSFGMFAPRSFLSKLEGTNLVHLDSQAITLTPRGKRFVRWLLDSGNRAEVFWSENGGWGDRAQVMKRLKDRASAAVSERPPGAPDER